LTCKIGKRRGRDRLWQRQTGVKTGRPDKKKGRDTGRVQQSKAGARGRDRQGQRQAMPETDRGKDRQTR
jgi:hypothetical protein